MKTLRMQTLIAIIAIVLSAMCINAQPVYQSGTAEELLNYLKTKDRLINVNQEDYNPCAGYEGCTWIPFLCENIKYEDCKYNKGGSIDDALLLDVFGYYVYCNDEMYIDIENGCSSV